MLFDNASPTIKNCIFVDNTGALGGAVFCYDSSPEFINCTFINNTAAYGAAVFAYRNAAPRLEYTIVAFNNGMAITCMEASSTEVSCCDVFGNTGGDFVDCLSGQEGIDGNYSLDPLLCHIESTDIDLHDESPCAPENNSCSALIGAGQVGCTCNCDDHGDLNLDGNIDPLDVSYMVNFVFKGLDAREQLPTCSGDNGDWDCDGSVDPIDFAFYVSFVFKSLGDGPCDPCTE